jgi:hypothetical protein
MALSKEDKSALINLIDIIEKLDDGAKKYLMGVADGMSFCNMSEDLKRKPEEKEAIQKGR